MEKMDELIRSLRECGNTLVSIADALHKNSAEPAAEASQHKKPSKKETKPALTSIDVRKLLSEKSRAGHTAEVKDLLKKYGAEKLSDLAEENYAAVAKEAEVL